MEENRFLNITENRDIDIKTLIQTLKDIKQLHENYPECLIETKVNHSCIKITNEIEFLKEATIELQYQDNGWKIKAHNLPEKAISANNMKVGTLKSTVENFLLICNNLYSFFKIMDSLEHSSCQILEPTEDKRDNASWRLLKYSKFLSIKVIFPNPFDVNDMSVIFYGKNDLVQKFNEIYQNQTTSAMDVTEDNEDVEKDIYRDLCHKLGVLDFPSAEDTIDCAICLCSENEFNQLPFVCCDNPKCECLFHVNCLSKHLNIKNTTILSTRLAICPFCKNKISSNFLSLLQNVNLLNEEN